MSERDEYPLGPAGRYHPQEGTPQYPARYPSVEYSYGYGPAIDDEIRVWDYLAILVRRRWTIAAVFVFCVLTAAILSLAATPMYRATSLLQIQPGGPNILSFEDVQESVAMSQAYNDFFQTQYDILSSRTLARRAIDELDLERNSWLTGEDAEQSLTGRARGWLAGLMAGGAVDTAGEQRRREHRMIENFLEQVQIKPRRKSFLVEVSFRSPDAELSAAVADTMAKEYIELTLDQRIEAASQGRDFIAKQLAITKARLEESEERLHRFARGRDIYALEQEERVIHERLVDLNARVTEAEAERIRLEAMVEQGEKGELSAIPQAVDNALVSGLKQELAKIEAERAEMGGRFTDEYPQMRVLAARIVQIRASIAAEESRILASLRSDYQSAAARESLLRRQLDGQRNVVAAYEDKAIDFKIMRREVDQNREIYESLLRRLKEVEVAEAIRASNITVVDRPEVPLDPASPNIPLNLALSFVVGLLGGVGVALFQDYLDDSVKSPDDVERYLRMPMLGAIPRFKLAGADARQPAVPGLSEEVHVTLQPTSAASEAIRTLRASLFLATPGGIPKRLLITSARPSEGKTCIAINLAAALAQMGQRVVVVDCDLRRPRVHQAFGATQSPGVTSYLTTGIEVLAVTMSSAQEGLDFISAGPTPPNPVDLLDSLRMAELFDALEPRYDHIIVDAPPALGFADVPVLTNRLGGACLLVARSGETSRRLARHACEYLIRMQSKLLGVVLNCVSTRGASYAYYGYYGEYYAREADAHESSPMRQAS